MPGPDGQGPSPARGEEPAHADEPGLACCVLLAVPPELRGPEEVWNGLGGDVVPQAHANRACREDDVPLARVPAGERVSVLVGEALAKPLHLDALRNGLGGEVRLPSEQLFAVVGDGAPVNLERNVASQMLRSSSRPARNLLLRSTRQGLPTRVLGSWKLGVTGASSKGGPFRTAASEGKPASDIDVFIEFADDVGLLARTSPASSPNK